MSRLLGIKVANALAGAVAILLLCGSSGSSNAQTYPSRPVTIIVPAPPGGGIDITARLIAKELRSALGQPFIVENKGGGSGNIGTGAAKSAAADGYTLFVTNSGFMVTNPSLFEKLQWDPVRDFSGVATIMNAPHLLVANNKFAPNTLPELVAYAKAHPGKVYYASPGVGTQNEIASETLAQIAKIDMVRVPYRSVPEAMQDVVAGRINIFINTTQSLVGPIQAKQVKPIALLSPSRLPTLPSVPTAGEQGYPKLDFATWYALYAPKGTPKSVLDLLASKVKTILARDDFKARVRQMGAEVLYKGPDDTDKFTKSEVARWADIIHKVGIKIQ